jgi:hypothetical protein
MDCGSQPLPARTSRPTKGRLLERFNDSIANSDISSFGAAVEDLRRAGWTVRTLLSRGARVDVLELERFEQMVAELVVTASVKGQLHLLSHLSDLIGSGDFIGDGFFFNGLRAVVELTLRNLRAGLDGPRAIIEPIITTCPKKGTFDRAVIKSFEGELAEVLASLLVDQRSASRLAGDIILFAKENQDIALAVVEGVMNALGRATLSPDIRQSLGAFLVSLYRDPGFERFVRYLGQALYLTNIAKFYRPELDKYRSALEVRLFSPYEDSVRKLLPPLVNLSKEAEQRRKIVDDEYRKEFERRLRSALEESVGHATARQEHNFLQLQVDLLLRISEIEDLAASGARTTSEPPQFHARILNSVLVMIQNLWLSHGVVKLGSEGEVTSFDPAIHKSVQASQASERVRVEVLRPGLAISDGGGGLRVIVRKAEVKSFSGMEAATTNAK